MKYLLLFTFLAVAVRANAQFTSAELGVDGLTCSMCARSVEMSIRRLPFVQDVTVNLRTTTMKVVFKKGEPVDIEKLATSVDDAGFSVGYLHASYVFNNLSAADGACFTQDGASYDFVGTGKKMLNGETVLKFIGDQYLSSDELAKWTPRLTNGCKGQGTKTYFVTPSLEDERYN
jgi:copper chaperone CopZ